MNHTFSDKIQFIWSIAEILRGDYKRADYGKVVLPMTIIRRLDCVLEPTKAKVLEKFEELKKKDMKTVDPILDKTAKQLFHNRSKLDFAKLMSDPDKIAHNLRAYINGFSASAREVIDKFEFDKQIEKLDEANLLFQVARKFSEIDLHPDSVSNEEMGYIFEELIRRFSEQSNETAGEHFTPREVIRLMVNLLFIEDNEILTRKGIVKSLYDPACGTGGMLSIADEYLREHNPDAELKLFGQELNDEAYAICKSDMMIKGQEPDNIKCGNSFSRDGFAGSKFDYMLSNPPFGVEWKKVEKEIRDEAESLGFNGRFGAGLPRINDGSFLFLLHMISKMKPADNGTRLAIVFNGSPLFTGSAGSGESDIRKWIIESDMLEAIIAMPDQLFYNTGIFTYVWIVTNRKPKNRRGKIQLVNAVGFFEKMRKSLGNKRHVISDKQIDEITKLYGGFKETKLVKIFDNDDFGYSRITVERPLRLNFAVSEERIERLKESSAFIALVSGSKKRKAKDGDESPNGTEKQEAILKALKTIDTKSVYKNRDKFTDILKSAFKKQGITIEPPLFKSILMSLSERDETSDICTDRSENSEPDPELRDYENIPLKEDIQAYFKREVLPFVPDAWIDETKTKKGYEINFNRYFYEYKPPRPLDQIEAELSQLEKEIADMLKEVAE
jgi:type I restriction enzyme M protein